MRPRTLGILALLVLAIGAFILFVERDLSSTDERRESGNRVLAVNPANVVAIAFEGDGVATRLELPDDTGDWQLVEPLTARADSDEVTGFLNDLEALEKVRTLVDVEPADVGLDDPRLHLTLATAERQWGMVVGLGVPATENVVVAVDGGGTFVTSGGFLDRTLREAGEWRDRQVVPGARSAVQEIRLSSPAGDVVLARNDGVFDLTVPLVDQADKEKVDELLEELLNLEVREFLDDPSGSALGLDSPQYEVTIIEGDRSAALSVRLGSVANEGGLWFASAENQVFTVETNLPSLLDRPAVQWQSLDWTILEAFEVDSVRLGVDGAVVELTREGGEWARDGEPVGYSEAADFLEAVVGVRGERLIDRPGSRAVETAGSEEIALEERPDWSVTLAGGGREEALGIWVVSEGRAYASREERPYLLELSSEAMERFAIAAEVIAAGAPGASPEPDPSTDDSAPRSPDTGLPE